MKTMTSAKRNTWMVFWCASSPALLLGCGSSNDVSADSACAVLAQAQCTRRQVCADIASGGGGTSAYPDGIYILKNYGDIATCLAQQKLACANGLAAPGIGTIPAQVEKCASDYPTWACVDLYDNGANPPADCALPGKQANGTSCAFNGQCASRFCSGIKNASCGLCADEPVDSTSCAASGCAPGQACKTESTGAQLCRDRLAVGDTTCTSDTVCTAFSSCIGSSATDPTKVGVCTATAVGVACGGASNPSCEGNLGLACLGPSGGKTCQTVAYVHAGAACATLADGSRADCIEGDCFTATAPAAATDTNATCKVKAAPGASCDTQLGPLCLAPARCVIAGAGTAGTCVVTLASMCSWSSGERLHSGGSRRPSSSPSGAGRQGTAATRTSRAGNANIPHKGVRNCVRP